MSDPVKIALISALVSITTAIITAVVTLSTSGIEKRVNEATQNADSALRAAESMVSLCRPQPESAEHTRSYDLTESTGKLIVLSANGRGTLRSGGGGRVVLRAQISVAGQLKARDSDFRSGGNLDNENDWGASAIHIFQASESTPTATVSVSKADPRNALVMESEIECLELALPARATHGG